MPTEKPEVRRTFLVPEIDLASIQEAMRIRQSEVDRTKEVMTGSKVRPVLRAIPVAEMEGLKTTTRMEKTGKGRKTAMKKAILMSLKKKRKKTKLPTKKTKQLLLLVPLHLLLLQGLSFQVLQLQLFLLQSLQLKTLLLPALQFKAAKLPALQFKAAKFTALKFQTAKLQALKFQSHLKVIGCHLKIL
jgi:hypothetical protein